MQYRDILVGQNGATPLPGTVVGFDAIVKIDDKVLYSTFNDKPIAFKVRQDVGSCSGDVGSRWWRCGQRLVGRRRADACIWRASPYAMRCSVVC